MKPCACLSDCYHDTEQTTRCQIVDIVVAAAKLTSREYMTVSQSQHTAAADSNTLNSPATIANVTRLSDRNRATPASIFMPFNSPRSRHYSWTDHCDHQDKSQSAAAAGPSSGPAAPVDRQNIHKVFSRACQSHYWIWSVCSKLHTHPYLLRWWWCVLASEPRCLFPIYRLYRHQILLFFSAYTEWIGSGLWGDFYLTCQKRYCI